MILDMYITMMPLLLGGIFNMVFTKTKLYKKYKYPIDCGRNWIDNKRIFGDNKTIIGFISMVVFCTLFQIIWGFICAKTGLSTQNAFYIIYSNTFVYNLLIGFLIGILYMLFELPNSFIKRRLNIVPGLTKKGLIGTLFFFIDQIDSLAGVFLLLILFSDVSFFTYLAYLFVGAFTHISVNLILFSLKIRRNI